MPGKTHCTYIPCQESLNPSRPILPPWEGHPALKLSLDCLEGYDRWVSEVVLPIAFQWIYENKDTVYKHVRPNLKDDVGAVIAGAFELVKEMDYYKEGRALGKEIEEKRKKHQMDTREFNPHWTAIADEAHDAIRKIFEKHESHLKEGIEGQGDETPR